MHYVDENGEVVEREELLREIEHLLNRLGSGDESVLSEEIMRELEIKDLLGIRNRLIQKNGKEIEQNQEWLFGLVDS
ncbi:hypothetical protein [Helicobacter kayseriensis]|uniref:hypothetical protein n=1 Tax=Helicobacter kayseriensis TaxID=2905877 RepID=UPI001E5384C8|nr:hypothetical protein [Helicobacter kayseriensis]MCE3047172.1 hypothetical protein [Helicobacter kayseriensis]MCE3048543.1 hypothetical protein [Helicobacter kayseriensis]